MNEEIEYGGIWDDAQEALRWRPVLPLVKAVREAKETPEKLTAIRNVAAFVVRNLTGKYPYTSPAFVAFALVVDLTHTDPRVRAEVERLLPR